MSETRVLRAGRLGPFVVDGVLRVPSHVLHRWRWSRQLSEWEARWESQRQREHDAELGGLVRAVLALGGMVCRLESDEGPVYVVEVYGESPDGEMPLLVEAQDPVSGLREVLAQLGSWQANALRSGHPPAEQPAASAGRES